ncbi:unnamed protein product [Protopolystoma xenopodis]|uniref:Uncharacterized protein n=1 Tax=Protopolystoma xenopodis TaxID=117903 RepID=A0A3S5A5G4_9PLAT|nr:unnamed protein product [Protopolystoma xenopodis]
MRPLETEKDDSNISESDGRSNSFSGASDTSSGMGGLARMSTRRCPAAAPMGKPKRRFKNGEYDDEQGEEHEEEYDEEESDIPVGGVGSVKLSSLYAGAHFAGYPSSAARQTVLSDAGHYPSTRITSPRVRRSSRDVEEAISSLQNQKKLSEGQHRYSNGRLLTDRISSSRLEDDLDLDDDRRVATGREGKSGRLSFGPSTFVPYNPLLHYILSWSSTDLLI